MADSLHPPPSLLSKVGSILIHLEEFEGKDGHHYDRAAVNALMSDPEVRGWLDGMHALALLPVKRSKDT